MVKSGSQVPSSDEHRGTERGIGGLHHSIAGVVELFAALLVTDEISAGAGARFLILALIGNMIGGTLFVALLNYGHIREGQKT